MYKQLRVGVHEDLGDNNFAFALESARKRNATAFQIFSKSSRSYWFNEEVFASKSAGFKEKLVESGLKLVIHVGFYVNLCSEKVKSWEDSILSLAGELLGAQVLGADYVVLHPGSGVNGGLPNFCDPVKQALKAIDRTFEILEGKEVPILLLESMPGAGTQIGGNLEDLAFLVKETNNKHKKKVLGVCLDTAHSFAAGYDFFSSKDSFMQFFAKFDEFIGIDSLYAFHLNGSQMGFGSKKDRHDNLQGSSIPEECFSWFINDSRLSEKIFILETPKENHALNLAYIKSKFKGVDNEDCRTGR